MQYDLTLPKFPYEEAMAIIVNAEASASFRELIDGGRLHEA